MPRRKLTGQDVELMRKLYAFFPGLSQENIAALFKVKQPTVCRIVGRHQWKRIK